MQLALFVVQVTLSFANALLLKSENHREVSSLFIRLFIKNDNNYCVLTVYIYIN